MEASGKVQLENVLIINDHELMVCTSQFCKEEDGKHRQVRSINETEPAI